MFSIFKPNAPLANAVHDIGKLGRDLTKQNHIIIMGGPGNSLERVCHYSIENNLNFTAERTFVNPFERHDKPWMNGRVRSMNLWLDRALLTCDMSHIVTDIICCGGRLHYACLHINS
jgi:hypothetical protein